MARLGFSPVKWDDGSLIILDQRTLPQNEEYRPLGTIDEVVEAIKNLSVRGAPLIGIVAAYGLCLVPDHRDNALFSAACDSLRSARPTAVNLAWAIDRMAAVRQRNLNSRDMRQILISEARSIHAEDADMCARIGMHGSALLPNGCKVLTHCNAGALATGGIGTALGVVYTAFFSGKKIEVWVDETRPVLQGARLTAWELSKAGIPYTLVSDSMAAHLMAQKRIDIVITGADRIARNLDFANKIGTYNLAVIAHHHKVPFYASAPYSTFDPDCPDGNSIIIELRPADEIRCHAGRQIAPADAPVYNPAFDVTPHELVSGIVTENGIIQPIRG
jgi:methylthioribose-1-phosphate isomerase